MKTALQNARVEKEVENAYWAAIRKDRPKASITSPHGTDGFATWGTVRLLLEAKFDLDFKARVPICNTLGQCLLYIKRFEQSGEPAPNVILVGDRNECFVLSTAAVKGFLDLPLDWTVAPSKGNPDLTCALVQGLNILPYVYDVNGNFKFRDVLAKIEALAEGEQHTVRANPANIGALFTYWRDRVFGAGKLTAVEQVDVFLKCLFQPADVYLHPIKIGLLVVPGYKDGVPVSAEQYRSFFSQFVQGYKPSEIEAFYANKDRLVEDDARRRQGAFFTPTLWVTEAHKMLDAELGPNWRNECIVYDPAAGTGNLTRDYHFADLIISTAEKPDVDVIKEQGYNPGASVFQYDFLNDDASPFFDGRNVIPDAVDDQLRTAAKAGKRLVLFMNPPYGTAQVAGTEKGANRAGVAVTFVNTDMKAAGIGASSQQLYAQFMFQCTRLAETYGFAKTTVATFSPPTFLCSGSYKGFRDFWSKRFTYKSGMLFQASHFADVSGRWGISFTVWSEGVTDPALTLSMALKDVQDFAVVQSGAKSFYNSNGREASQWVRDPTKGLKGDTGLSFTSGLKVRETDGLGKWTPNSVMYFQSNANCVQHNAQLVNMFSAPFSSGQGLSILPGESFRRATALYAARKLITNTWINHTDEYLRPTGSPTYKQWNDDAIIYTLLHNSNNCTAMRNVVYKGKQYRIKNNFYWRTLKDSKALYDQQACKGLTADLRGEQTDSYLATILPTLDLSPEARTVLNKLDALLVQSAPVREAYAAGKPELHLTAHDAGVYQLKHLWRDLFPAEWTDLQVAFKVLADKLRPGVYGHGFLLR